MIQEAYLHGFFFGLKKLGRELTAKSRGSLPDSAFIYPEQRKFPIPDRAHGRAALGRAHFASDPTRVRAAVYAKFPELKPIEGS